MVLVMRKGGPVSNHKTRSVNLEFHVLSTVLSKTNAGAQVVRSQNRRKNKLMVLWHIFLTSNSWLLQLLNKEFGCLKPTY